MEKTLEERRRERFKEAFWIMAICGGLAAIPLWIAFSTVRSFQADARQVEARIAHIRTATASDLSGNAPDAEVVTQGRISRQAPPKHGPFVAYVEIETVYGEGTTTEKRADIRPPLRLETAKGNISIEDYELQYPSDEKAGNPSDHYSGLTPGQLVVVGGNIERGSHGPVFRDATVLDAKTSYASFLRDQIESPVLSVIMCGLVALFFLGCATLLLWLSGK